MPREIDEIARGGENALGSLSHFDSCRRNGDVAGPPFDQLRADLALQFSDLHRERGLRHCAIVRGAAKMPVACERREVSQLT